MHPPTRHEQTSHPRKDDHLSRNARPPPQGRPPPSLPPSPTISLTPLTPYQLPNTTPPQTIPQIHLGLYMLPPRQTAATVTSALTAGYRGFDSAQWYNNEREAGGAIKSYLSSHPSSPPLSRPDVFYTTKLRDNSTSYEAVRASVKKSIDACGLGYVDLFLLHSPLGGREARLVSPSPPRHPPNAPRLTPGRPPTAPSPPSSPQARSAPSASATLASGTSTSSSPLSNRTTAAAHPRSFPCRSPRLTKSRSTRSTRSSPSARLASATGSCWRRMPRWRGGCGSDTRC